MDGDKPSVYQPKQSVTLTPERIRELLKEGQELARKARKLTERMTWLAPEDWTRLVK